MRGGRVAARARHRMGEESIGLEADWIGLEADRCNFFVTLEASIIESAQF